jgi:hypothetical protein
MQFIIDQSDLHRLSSSARAELWALIQREHAPPKREERAKKGFRWRAPYDMTPDLTRKLMRGLSKESKKRLELFAGDSGRVTVSDLLAVTGDEDWRALSTFEGNVTRKLRRLVGDEDKMISLIMWDYGSETWDADHKTLLDGVYYVSDATAASLRSYFGR